MLVLSFFKSFTTVCSCYRPSSAPKEEFTIPSYSYMYIHAIQQVSMSRECAEHFRTTYKASVLLCVLVGAGSVLNLTDVRTTTVVRLQYGNKVLTATVHVSHTLAGARLQTWRLGLYFAN